MKGGVTTIKQCVIAKKARLKQSAQLKLSFKRLPRSCVARNDDTIEEKEKGNKNKSLRPPEIKGTTLIYFQKLDPETSSG